MTPVKGWIKQYKAGEMTFEELKDLVAGHDFEVRESSKRTLRDKMFEAYGGCDPMGIEDGTLDDIVFDSELTSSERAALHRVARTPDEEIRNRANPPGLWGVEK